MALVLLIAPNAIQPGGTGMPIPSRLLPLSLTFVLLLLLAATAAARQPCSDWYINKVLKEMLNCSPQDIDDICSGRRPRPPEMPPPAPRRPRWLP